MIRIIMERIIKHNIKAEKLAWQQTKTDRSKTLMQWDGPSINEATALTVKHEFWTIKHDFQIDPPAAAGELPLPRCVGRAARIPEQHATMAQLDSGALTRGVLVDVVQTATGVQYQGSDPAGSTERGRDAASA